MKKEMIYINHNYKNFYVYLTIYNINSFRRRLSNKWQSLLIFFNFLKLLALFDNLTYNTKMRIVAICPLKH